MNRRTALKLMAWGLGMGVTNMAEAQSVIDRARADELTLVNGNTEFAVDVYARLCENPGNLFFSPYSISTALAMTYAGARGETAEQMATTLHFMLEQQRLHPAFHSLLAALQGPGQKRKYQLQTANRLWGQRDYGFLPDFLKTTEKNYGAGLQELDFIMAREEARKTINAWVEKQTQEKIKELIKPNMLGPTTRLVLTNAIYFKAAWMHPFSPEQTKEGDFTLANGKKIKARLMRGHNKTRYFKGDTFAALELPYEQHDLSMIVLLPDKADGLPALEQKLRATNLTQWLGKLSGRAVDVTLPKFKLTSEFVLNDVLSKMGMPTAFDPAKADFSGMATHGELFIGYVLHKAFVEVNEAGTEAAAATAVVMREASARLEPPVTFRADHPFLFLLHDNRTGSILFLGRVTEPSTGAGTEKE